MHYSYKVSGIFEICAIKTICVKNFSFTQYELYSGTDNLNQIASRRKYGKAL